MAEHFDTGEPYIPASGSPSEDIAKLRRDAENILTWDAPKDGDLLMFGHLRHFAKAILRLTENTPHA